MKDPTMPKVDMHDILSKLDAEEKGQKEEDFRPPSIRAAEQNAAGDYGPSSKRMNILEWAD